MAIKNIVAQGIGFNPGSIKFIVTHGFIAAVLANPVIDFSVANQLELKNADWKVSDGTVNTRGFIGNIVTKTSDYTLTDLDYTALVEASSNTVDIFLPSLSGNFGRVYNVKSIDSTFAARLVADGSDLIDGSANLTLALDESKTVQAGAVQWRII